MLKNTHHKFKITITPLLLFGYFARIIFHSSNAVGQSAWSGRCL